MTYLSEIGERRIIEEIIHPYLTEPINNIILDDAAPIPAYPQNETLFVSVDQGPRVTFLEDLNIGEKSDIGQFHVTLNVSDIAAMGATPTAMVLALNVPSNTTIHELKNYLDGVKGASLEYQIPLIGGDLSEGSHWHSSITVFGTVEKEKALVRSAAKPGDRVYITDNLGKTLSNYIDVASGYAKKVSKVTACLSEGRQLAQESDCKCAMDMSDGLIASASQIAKLSNVGIELDLNGLVFHYPKALKESERENWKKFLLSVGGDYELIFTHPAPYRLPNKYTEVGVVTQDWKGVRLKNEEAIVANNNSTMGWEHFIGTSGKLVTLKSFVHRD